MKREEAINFLISEEAKENRIDTNLIRDGYHSFGELYEHRITLFIALCKMIYLYTDNKAVWKSKFHSDGSNMEGWFILGIDNRPGEQITYHLPNIKWTECPFAKTLSKAPAWDGHTPEDVLKRITVL